MHEFWEKVEHFNARLIPVAILSLLVIIFFELFMHTEDHTLELGIEILDYFVLTVFVIDLIFLAIRARTVKFFFKSYWLDIIAVFPFNLIFSLVSRIYEGIVLAERALIGQKLLHETLEVEKVVARSSRIAKYLRIAARVLRVITKSRLFSQIHHKHHLARRGVHTQHNQRRKIQHPRLHYH